MELSILDQALFDKFLMNILIFINRNLQISRIRHRPGGERSGIDQNDAVLSDDSRPVRMPEERKSGFELARRFGELAQSVLNLLDMPVRDEYTNAAKYSRLRNRKLGTS